MKKIAALMAFFIIIITFVACRAGGGGPAATEEVVEVKESSVFYKNGYDNSMIVGIDQFGRTFDIVGDDREGKDVGMFFWLWIGQPYASGVYDAEKILKEYGKETLFFSESKVSPNNQAHFWGEPLWGYYNSADEWVIRKQIELLTEAGIDFIVFDTTNAVTYWNVYTKIAKVISEFMSEGWNPPKLAFYTHSQSMKTVTQIYNEFYRRNLYPESWYRIDGKPMIIGYTDPKYDTAEADSRNDTSYKPPELSQEILDFFYFKQPRWPFDSYDDPNVEDFPWIEWSYPQPLRGNMMSVTVASHPGCPMSFSLTRKNWINWGRGWNVETQENVSEDVDKGTFFQSQWDTAIQNDPDIVFVGGWNEWIAYKQIYDGEYMLCDAASKEFSRDIEMMKGGYNDAFYIQLIQNVRKYKGTKLDRRAIGFSSVTVDITGDMSAWDSVNEIYRDVGKENYERNSVGVTEKLKYKMDAPRNNLQTVKVTRDDSFLYFYIESEDNITENDGNGNWMNIFITPGDVRETGWVCYDYALNRSISGDTGSVEKLNADGSGTKVGECIINVRGNVMQVAVPRNLIGLSDSCQCYFKVADGVENPTDIMDYYVTGKVLPVGRLSYSYGNKEK